MLNFFEYLKAKTESYLKNNRFEVSFSVPYTVSFFGLSSYLCTAASMNFFQILSDKQYYNGKYYNAAYGRDYDPIVLTFDVDEGVDVLTFFKNWISVVSPTDGTLNYPNEYQGTISVSALTEGLFSSTAFTSQLNKAYPINISNIAYDQYAVDQIVSVSVTFEYESITFDDGSYFF